MNTKKDALALLAITVLSIGFGYLWGMTNTPTPGSVQLISISNPQAVVAQVAGVFSGASASYDLNRDGKVDYKDLVTVARAFGSVRGSASYATSTDIDRNGVIDERDVQYIRSHYSNSTLIYDTNGTGVVGPGDTLVVAGSFGKSASAKGYNPIADIDGNSIVDQRDVQYVRNHYTGSSTPFDLTGDTKVNYADLLIVASSYGLTPSVVGYNSMADVDGNGVVDERDVRYIRDHYTSPMLAFDLNGDGRVDFLDVAVVSKAFGGISGNGKYNPLADIDGNGTIDSRDIRYVRDRYSDSREVFDLNGDRKVNYSDEVVVVGSLNTKLGVSSFNPLADIDGNDIVDAQDLEAIKAHPF